MEKKYEEKRAEYDAKRKANIAEQKKVLKEIKALDPTQRRLYFFDQIIRSMGLTQSEFAKITGDSQQKISWMFSTADDASLSYIQDSLAKLKVRITPSFEKKAVSTTIVETSDIKVIGILPKAGNGVSKAAYVDECIERGGRMTFLAHFIKDSGMNVTNICRKVGMDPSSMRFLFEHDDTKVSMLLKIAKTFDCTLNWSVETIKK